MAYETWEVNGYNLSSLAHDIQTYDGLDDVPDLIVTDIPRMQDHGVDPGVGYYGPGRKAVAMIVNTVADDGTSGSTPDAQRAIFDQNLDYLMRVFYRRSLLNVKRTMANGLVKNAYCRVVTGIQPKRLGLSAGTVIFDLDLPYSFWYGDVDLLSKVTSPNTAAVLNEFANATAPLNELVYEMVGPATNPKITDPETGSWVQYNGTIATGSSVKLVNTDQSIIGGSLANVAHSGDPKWLTLYPTPSGVLVTYDGGNAASVLNITGREKYLR